MTPAWLSRLRRGHAYVALLVLGMIICFVCMFAQKPPYWDEPPPPFNTTACSACAYTTQWPCPNVFTTGSLTNAIVCYPRTIVCCCPAGQDEAGTRVGCAYSWTQTTCMCRHERRCGESCFIYESLPPMVVGIALGAALFVISVRSLCRRCRRQQQAEPPQEGKA
ncbi:hypothetical protein AC1031_002529 [Aphanomyces cochlioides]|nr:hypothetical protein AC1031_002529 [Aphanomyces cochlioides]